MAKKRLKNQRPKNADRLTKETDTHIVFNDEDLENLLSSQKKFATIIKHMKNSPQLKLVLLNGHFFLARAHSGTDLSGTGGHGQCRFRNLLARALHVGQRALNGQFQKHNSVMPKSHNTVDSGCISL